MLRRHQVREYLKSTSATLGNYTNLCGNLVSETVSWLGSGLKLDLFNPRGLLRPDPALGAPPVWPGFSTRVGLIQVPLWYYHSVFVLDGFVHELFLPEPIRVQRYLERYFNQGDLGLFLKDAIVIGSPQKSQLWSRLKRKRQDPENTQRLRDYVTALRDQFNFEWAQAQAISPRDSFEASAEILAKFPGKLSQGPHRGLRGTLARGILQLGDIFRYRSLEKPQRKQRKKSKSQSLANRSSGIRDFDESMRSKPSPQVETMESRVARLEAEIVKLKEQVGLARNHAWRASRKRETPMLWNPLRSNGSLLGG